MPPPAPPAAGPPSRPSFWRRRVVEPLRDQLRQGATPPGLARALGVGLAIAVNPFLGTTTVLCLAAGVAGRLNHVALQVANVAAAPLQLALIVPWARAGEWLWDAPAVALAPTALVAAFRADPAAFFAQFGRTGLHAATAWLLAAPVIAWLVARATRPALARAAAFVGRREDRP